jgi:beta-fructofuranosidase
LLDTPWQPTGEIIRVDRHIGESLAERGGEECIQSPFVVTHQDKWYMFYGGDGSGLKENGEITQSNDPDMAGQICLMTSSDGRTWTRHRNANHQSRLFIGPMATRDPCLLKYKDYWILYYAGYWGYEDGEAGFYARTSSDLIHWSEKKLVHQDAQYGGHRWQTECPHVVYRAGYYYLFRTVNYEAAETYVFRSENPLDFGIGNASSHFVGRINVAAPEVIIDCDGTEYITSNHNLFEGTMLCELRWESYE